MNHYLGCTSNYPEKPANEAPQQIEREILEDGYYVDTCVDCGAFETNLPSKDDPYWDDVKKELR